MSLQRKKLRDKQNVGLSVLKKSDWSDKLWLRIDKKKPLFSVKKGIKPVRKDRHVCRLNWSWYPPWPPSPVPIPLHEQPGKTHYCPPVVLSQSYYVIWPTFLGTVLLLLYQQPIAEYDTAPKQIHFLLFSERRGGIDFSSGLVSEQTASRQKGYGRFPMRTQTCCHWKRTVPFGINI